MDNYLLKMYKAFDLLYRDIRAFCACCEDHDCEGYVWLLKEEAESLYEFGIPIVEINKNTDFIHSFEETNGALLVNKLKPPCRLRQNGFCSIYNLRPLLCRMYPLGLVTEGSEILLALHKDCKFSREIDGEFKREFIEQAIKILKLAPIELLEEIVDAYEKVDEISAFPEGPNTYEVIIPFRLFIQERR